MRLKEVDEVAEGREGWKFYYDMNADLFWNEAPRFIWHKWLHPLGVGGIKRSSIAFDCAEPVRRCACARIHSKIQVLHCVQCALVHRHTSCRFILSPSIYWLCHYSRNGCVKCNNVLRGINVSAVSNVWYFTGTLCFQNFLKKLLKLWQTRVPFTELR